MKVSLPSESGAAAIGAPGRVRALGGVIVGAVYFCYLFPQPLEPMPGNTGVMGCVLGIAVAEVALHSAQIGTLVGQIVPARVTQHVRPNAADLRILTGHTHDVVDRLAGELGLSLGYEQPRQGARAGGKVALDGAQLVPGLSGARRTGSLWMIYRHGLRVSEAIGMRRDQLDIKRPPLWVERLI
jgi:hypothetical protein